MTKEEQELLSVVANNVEWIRLKTDEHARTLEHISEHLREINSSVQKHHTTLFGERSDEGLCGDFFDLRRLNRRNFLLIVGILIILAGAGVLNWTGILPLLV